MEKIEELVCLEIEGDYGHFRKSYTTSSPLTHGVPPRTAITGFLGALMGLPQKGENNYHYVFHPERARIALIIKNPIQRKSVNKNMLKVKGETGKLIDLSGPPREIERNQVPFEILRNPKYRVYLWLEDKEKEKKFVEIVENHKSVFTPYLGISEFIADFNYLGKKNVDFRRDSDIQIDSVLRKESYQPIFEKGKKYRRENTSLLMNEDRVVKEFGEILYEESGDSIEVNNAEYFEVDKTGENITFLTG